MNNSEPSPVTAIKNTFSCVKDTRKNVSRFIKRIYKKDGRIFLNFYIVGGR